MSRIATGPRVVTLANPSAGVHVGQQTGATGQVTIQGGQAMYRSEIFGGGDPTCGEILSKFCPVEKYFLPKIGDFFEIFEMYLHTTPQKSLFIAFLLTNSTKISKKVLKNSSRRLRRRKRVEIFPCFTPSL